MDDRTPKANSHRCRKDVPNNKKNIQLLLIALLFPDTVLAREATWWDEKLSFQLDGIVSATDMNIQDELFNQPFSVGNFTGLSNQLYEFELRPNIELSISVCDVNLKPRYHVSYSEDRQPENSESDTFFNTALVACRLADSMNLKVGRQRVTWGNSQFRSPSNPFYSESTLFNPLSEIVGKDFAIFEYSASFSWKISVIANWDESHVDRPPNPNYQFLKTYGFKTEYTGQSSQWGGILSKRENKPLRFGGFSNYTLNRAVLIYGEFSVSKDSVGLLPVTDQDIDTDSNLIPLTFVTAEQVDKKYRYSVLAGASYTLMNGWTTSAEYLNTNEGFNNAQTDDWIDAGAAAILKLNAGEDVTQAVPVLVDAFDPLWRQLRQNYVILGLNRTQIRNSFDVAFQNITNLDDKSNSIAASIVYQSSDSTELFLVGNANTGGGSSEFDRLVENIVVIGLRFYTF